MADRPGGAVRGLLALLVAGLLAGCGSGQMIQTPDNGGYFGTYMEEPYQVSAQTLTDTSGRAVALSTSPAKVEVVFFGYTHCPDICQIMMSTIASALTRLSPAQQHQVGVAFVTTDPARDSGPVLRSYLDHFNPAFVGLTGSLAQIKAVATPMKVFFAPGRRLASGGYEIDHATYVFGVRGGGVRLIWSQGTSPAQMAADIIVLLKS